MNSRPSEGGSVSMIGTSVSRYRILSKLGEGGMGVVYEATDTELGRNVAIKFLPEAAAISVDSLERFKREARAASALNHPHICAVYDIGQHDGRPYFVMEKLSGRTLKYLIGSRGMRLQDVTRLGEQIAGALDAAHRAGIVHRDLKPPNLFVTETGDVKVLDFGLAKRADDSESSNADTVTFDMQGDRAHTSTGQVLGTLLYMSPEQARGLKLDGRSDVFSLGIVLYQMATGHVPFEGENTAEFFAALLEREPLPPRWHRPEIPERLEEVILKALEKDPALRYQSAAGLRADLLRMKRDASGPSRASAASVSGRFGAPSSGRMESAGSVRWFRLGVAVLAIAAVAGIGYLATRGGSFGGAPIGTGAPADARAPRTPNVALASEKSIAVLPFLNMSSDREQEYFSDGISEELLNLLAQVPELEVTAQTSSFAFKGKDVGIPEIARQLGVANVLEGSVRRSGDQVRIAAQLVRASDGIQIWSSTYDRKLDDVFKIQDEIAEEVVKELKVTLLAASPKSRPTDPGAFAQYLQARVLARVFTKEAFARSDALYRQILEVDPRYAPAWDGLATNFLNEANLGLLSNQEGYARAREAEERALAIDPDFAPAHAALGWIAMRADNDLAGAATRFERALELDPHDLRLLGSAATFLQDAGRLGEALAIKEAIVHRDPVNLRALHNLGVAQRRAGRFDAAIATFRSVLALSPGRGGAHYSLGTALLQKGDAEGALAEFEQEASEPRKLTGLSMARFALGRTAESDAAIAALTAKYERDRPYEIALVHAFRNEVDEAFEWLDKAIEHKDPALSGIATENLLENIRSDRRWLPFLRRIGRAPDQLAQIEFHASLPTGGAASP